MKPQAEDENSGPRPERDSGAPPGALYSWQDPSGNSPLAVSCPSSQPSACASAATSRPDRRTSRKRTALGPASRRTARAPPERRLAGSLTGRASPQRALVWEITAAAKVSLLTDRFIQATSAHGPGSRAAQGCAETRLMDQQLCRKPPAASGSMVER